MRAAVGPQCPSCEASNPLAVSACVYCGHHFDAAPASTTSGFDLPRPQLIVRPDRARARTSLLYLAIGAFLAPALTFTPLLQYMGWFFGSLCHEMGHCVVAWFVGSPAFPAISLAGHAMARYSEQQIALAILMWAAMAWLAWQYRHRRRLLIVFAAATLLYPVIAFTGMREFFFLMGGHIGELTLAAVFFKRAIDGGFTDSSAERAAYATMAWFLMGQNVWLTGGLLWSAEVQAWYARSGSFGLTNDYIRVARSVLHIDLSVVAGFMLLVSVLPLPLAWLLREKR